MGVDESIHITAGAVHGEVHTHLNGGFTLALHNVAIQIRDDHIVCCDGVILHGAGSQIHKTGFGVAGTDVSPGFHSQPGVGHSKAALDYKLTIIHSLPFFFVSK